MGTCIEPGKSSAQSLYLQFLILQKLLVHGGNFQFSTCRRLDMPGYIHHLIRIEIKPYHRIVGFRLSWFFLYGETITVYVKLSHAVTLRIIHPVTEHRCFLFLFCRVYCLTQQGGKTVPVKNVVTQHKADGIVPDELFPDKEGLCQSVRRGLLGVLKMYAIIRSIAQQPFEPWQVIRGGDDQDIPNTGQHQDGDGVIYHRFVKNREQLFAHAFGDGIEAGTATTG